MATFYRHYLMLVLVLFFVIGLSGCYTRLGNPGMRSSPDQETFEYYVDEAEDEEYIEGEGEIDEDVVYHKHEHYVGGGHAPLFLDTWWYEPYWSMRMGPYWGSSYRYWGWHDPYWDYYHDPYYGMGYYGASSYCMFCPGYMGGMAYYGSG